LRSARGDKSRCRRKRVSHDHRRCCARPVIRHCDRVGEIVSQLDRTFIRDFCDRQVSLRHDGVGVYRDVDVGIAIQTGESLARRAGERGRTVVWPPVRCSGEVAPESENHSLLSAIAGDRKGQRDRFHSVDQGVRRPEHNTGRGIAEDVIGPQLSGNSSVGGRLVSIGIAGIVQIVGLPAPLIPLVGSAFWIVALYDPSESKKCGPGPLAPKSYLSRTVFVDPAVSEAVKRSGMVSPSVYLELTPWIVPPTDWPGRTILQAFRPRMERP